MPTYTFNLPIDEMFEDAFEMVGMNQVGADNLRSAKRSLNLLMIDLQNRDIPLSHLEKVTLPLVQGQQEYTLDTEVLDVINVSLRRDGIDYPLRRMGLFDYNAQPNKSQEGRVLSYTLDRQKDAAILSVWPTSENATDTLIAWTYRKNADVTNYTDYVDVATRYIPAITVGLAYFLSIKFNMEKTSSLKSIYEEMLERAFEEDRERTSVFFYPASGR